MPDRRAPLRGRAKAVWSVVLAATLAGGWMALAPGGVGAASNQWSVTATPPTLAEGQSTTVSLAVTAITGAQIGCVIVTIPTGFTVLASSAPSPWVVQPMGMGPPTRAQFNVTSDPQLLTPGDSVTFGVTVIATASPVGAWTVASYQKFDSTSPSNGVPVTPLLPFTIIPTPTPRPTPTPTPRQTPTPTPRPTPLTSPTPPFPSFPLASSGPSTPPPGPTSNAAPPSGSMPAPLPVPAPPVFTTWAGMPLDVSGAQLLGGTALEGAVVVVTQPTTHGQLSVSPDGSFTYVPAAGFLGTDSFWVATSRASRRSDAVQVVIRVLPVAASPSPATPSAAPRPSPSGDAFVVGSTSRGGSSGSGVSFGTLGPLDFAFEWLIPGFVVALPGLLVVLVVLAQALVGSAWLPLVRRDLGDFGLRRRR